MKKALVIIVVLLILISLSCVKIFTMKPSRIDEVDRIASFPDADLPLEKPVTLYWNAYKVPFIIAETDVDCAFTLGMVHAHLRLGQLTLFRQVVRGRLSESLGPFVTRIDQTIRTMQLGMAVDSMESRLPGKTRAWLSNYVRGLNHYQANLSEEPFEVKLLGLSREPWTVEDILLLGRLMAIDVNWANWFSWLKLQDKPYWERMWTRFVDSGLNSTPTFSTSSSSFNAMLSAGMKSGSNALAVHGSKTGGEGALMASDPHLGLQLPNTWLIAGYKCPSYHVLGLMLPGVPMVLVGRNENIAWAGTNMRSASSDLYELPSHYADSIAVEDDTIKVRWWKDKPIELRTSPFGPIISDAPLFSAKEDQALALKWVGHDVSDEFSSFLDVNAAEDWDDFRSAFEPYGVSGQNFIYAGKDGHIGMVLALMLPERHPDLRPRLTLDPDSLTHAWLGRLPSTELPYALDPASGFIASTNNRPVEIHPPIGYFFSANDRIDRLSQLLSQDERIDIGDLKRIQEDVYIPSAIEARDIIVGRLDAEALNAGEREALGILQSWNGEYTEESVGPVVFEIFMTHFVTRFYGDTYDEDFAKLLLASEQKNFFATQDIGSDTTGTIEEYLSEALESTAEEFQKYENWGDMHRLKLSHPLGNIPIVGGRYRFGDFPARGSYNSLMKTAHNTTNERHSTFYGANSRFICKVNDLNANYFVLLGGQDGWMGSDHFTDQVDLWLQGKYIEIPMDAERVSRNFESRIDLKPAD
jgi:penicillin amidase